jgi:hypothetical protein
MIGDHGDPENRTSRARIAQPNSARCLYESYFGGVKVYVSAIPHGSFPTYLRCICVPESQRSAQKISRPVLKSLRRITTITVHSCCGSFVTLPRLKDPVTGPQPFLPVRLGFPIGLSPPPAPAISTCTEAVPRAMSRYWHPARLWHIPAMAHAPDKDEYKVVVAQRGQFARRWEWEIFRNGRPLPVPLRNRRFWSERAAKAAGEAALRDFLEALARDQNN